MNKHPDTETSRVLAQIEAFEARWHYDSAYMKHMLRAHPEAFSVFQAVLPMVEFRRSTTAEVSHVVKLAAFQMLDCGPCLQLAIDRARADGIPPARIQAVLEEPSSLPEDLADIRTFVRSLFGEASISPEQRGRLRLQWGEEVMVEIALLIAAAGVFPMIKKVLGYFESARTMRIQV